MYFEPGHLYHIYNQGNNRQRIFFRSDNYFYFIKKLSVYILPYADILAWCLMPNHFHLMVYYRESVVATNEVTLSHPVSNSNPGPRSFNDSIGIMLRSYTRAVNKQENRSGSLFREETKAICLTKPDDKAVSWYKLHGITTFSDAAPEKQYPNSCFNYILNNPVKHGLVMHPGEWEYSSYLDFQGLRDLQMINMNTINQFELKLL